jgi:hypothetical protein
MKKKTKTLEKKNQKIKTKPKNNKIKSTNNFEKKIITKRTIWGNTITILNV